MQKRKHKITAWKLWIYFFQQSLIFEILITTFFWGMLYRDFKKMSFYQSPIRQLSLVLDHLLPLFCLILDYSVNSMPFIKRHLWPIIFTVTVYICVDFAFVKLTGKIIYKILNWNDIFSFVLSIIAIIFLVIVFNVVYWINNKKLKLYANRRL